MIIYIYIYIYLYQISHEFDLRHYLKARVNAERYDKLHFSFRKKPEKKIKRQKNKAKDKKAKVSQARFHNSLSSMSSVSKNGELKCQSRNLSDQIADNGVAQWFVRLTCNVKVMGLSPIKGPRCFLEQET